MRSVLLDVKYETVPRFHTSITEWQYKLAFLTRPLGDDAIRVEQAQKSISVQVKKALEKMGHAPRWIKFFDLEITLCGRGEECQLRMEEKELRARLELDSNRGVW